MRRIIPSDIYREKPCSVVSLGCALQICDERALSALVSPYLRGDGYLSLKGMNELVRANCRVVRRTDYRRGERPALRDWAHEHLGERAVVCVAGHFVYFDGKDYHSFFFNGGDPVICVWTLG